MRSCSVVLADSSVCGSLFVIGVAYISMNRLLRNIYIWTDCHTAALIYGNIGLYIWFVIVYFISSSTFNVDFIHNFFFGPHIALHKHTY